MTAGSLLPPIRCSLTLVQKPALLKVTNRFGVERSLALEKPLFTIGRKAENDLQLLSDTVSRQHAEIIYEDDTYFLVDRSSKRGSYVNDQRVERSPLQHLDVIRIGGDDHHKIQFIDETLTRAEPVFNSHPSLRLSMSGARAASANEELQKLARYVEVNQAFKFSLTPDDVLTLIVDAAIEMTQADRGFLMLRNEHGDLEFKVARDKDRNWLVGNDFDTSRTVVEAAFRQNRSIVVDDSMRSELLISTNSSSHLESRSIACIPLRHFQMSEDMDSTSVLKRDVIGVLYVDSNSPGRSLSQTSLRLLDSLAFEATKSLESVRLMHEEQEKKQIEQELNMARQVQVLLSPTRFRQPEYFEVAAESIPSRYVGGDFYDLVSLSDGRSVVLLGDVSGKGIAAALLGAMAQGALQAQFTSGLSIEAAIAGLNRVLVQKSAADRFITLFCAVLSPDGEFVYINAGHNLPILIRKSGETEFLTTKSVLLGAFDFAKYEALSTKLESGDVVIIYTDGVTEAVNVANQMFGDERLTDLACQITGLTAAEIKNRILRTVITFTGEVPQGDDITLIALKMK